MSATVTMDFVKQPLSPLAATIVPHFALDGNNVDSYSELLPHQEENELEEIEEEIHFIPSPSPNTLAKETVTTPSNTGGPPTGGAVNNPVPEDGVEEDANSGNKEEIPSTLASEQTTSWNTSSSACPIRHERAVSLYRNSMLMNRHRRRQERSFSSPSGLVCPGEIHTFSPPTLGRRMILPAAYPSHGPVSSSVDGTRSAAFAATEDSSNSGANAVTESSSSSPVSSGVDASSAGSVQLHRSTDLVRRSASVGASDTRPFADTTYTRDNERNSSRIDNAHLRPGNSSEQQQQRTLVPSPLVLFRPRRLCAGSLGKNVDDGSSSSLAILRATSSASSTRSNNSGGGIGNGRVNGVGTMSSSKKHQSGSHSATSSSPSSNDKNARNRVLKLISKSHSQGTDTPRRAGPVQSGIPSKLLRSNHSQHLPKIGLSYAAAMAQTKTALQVNNDLVHLAGPEVYACQQCRTHFTSHSDIISKSFHGRHGRAYLLDHAVNVTVGPAEDRVLMTGLHAVCDLFCQRCRTLVGWTYQKAYEASQKYKEGKFIIEKIHLYQEPDHEFFENYNEDHFTPNDSGWEMSLSLRRGKVPNGGRNHRRRRRVDLDENDPIPIVYEYPSRNEIAVNTMAASKAFAVTHPTDSSTMTRGGNVGHDHPILSPLFVVGGIGDRN